MYLTVWSRSDGPDMINDAITVFSPGPPDQDQTVIQDEPKIDLMGDLVHDPSIFKNHIQIDTDTWHSILINKIKYQIIAEILKGKK